MDINQASDSGLVQLYHAQLQQTFDLFYRCETKPSLYTEGTFGIGKTHAARLFAQRKAKELGLEFSEDFRDINDPKKFMFLVFVVHQYDEAEFKGIPFPNKEGTKTVYLPMGLMPIAGQGLLFLDEINLARKGVQNNCFQLIEDRRLGLYVIPDGYMVCGAGNKSTDRSNTYDMPMPLLDRFFRAELLVPPVHNVKQKLGGGKEIIIPGWVEDYAVPNGIENRIVYYLMWQPKDLYTYNAEDPASDPVPATPRGWKKFSDVLKLIPADDFHQIQQVGGMKVGRARASKFISFIKLREKHDVAKIYQGADFKLPTEVSVLYALISGLVGFYLEKQDGEHAARLVELSSKFQKEHQLLMLTQATEGDPDMLDKAETANVPVTQAVVDEVFRILLKK